MSDWHVTRIAKRDRERLERLARNCSVPTVITALLDVLEAAGVVGIEVLPGPVDGAKVPLVHYKEQS